MRLKVNLKLQNCQTIRAYMKPNYAIKKRGLRSDKDLSVRSIASSCDHLMEVRPINNPPLRYTPYPDLGIKRATDEIIVIHWIELYTCNC